MSNEVFESALMKARKLAALAAVGVGGEKDNAMRALDRHLRTHGLTLNQLRTDTRTERVLPCFDARRKPMVNADLVKLAVQCLAYVLNAPVSARTGKQKFAWRNAKGRQVMVSGDVMLADLTDLEVEDWVACFAHFMPSFLATQKKLKAAVKQCLSGFVHQHKIYRDLMDDEEEGGMMTDEQLEALVAAMRAAEGSRWKRPAGRLTGDELMLA